MRAFVAALLLTLLAAAPLAAQTNGAWQALTSLRNVTAADVSDEAVWVATTGGVYSYAPEDGAIGRYTVVEGLHAPDARALAYDAERDAVWIGYGDGVLDRLDVQTGAVTAFRDVARADRFEDRAIQRLRLVGDTLYAATGFGLVVFDPERGEVRDSYTQFGSFTSGIAVYDVTHAPTPDGQPGLWAATAEGLAYAPMAASNLRDPASWQTETPAVGAPGNPSDDAETPAVYAVAAFDGTLYAGTDRDLRLRQPDGTYRRSGATGRAVRDLLVTPRRLYGIDRFRVLTVDANGIALAPSDLTVRPSSLAGLLNGLLWIGDERQGLLAAPPATATAMNLERQILPDGPYDGLFDGLTVADDGTVWVGGGIQSGTGLYAYQDGAWTSYTRRTLDPLSSRSNFYRIALAEDAVYAGTYGFGLVRVDKEDGLPASDDAEAFTFYEYGDETPLRSPYNVPDLHYAVVSGVAVDDQGQVWVANFANPTAQLWIFDPEADAPDDVWTAIPDVISTQRYGLGKIYLDTYGQVWSLLRSTETPDPLGVAVLSLGGTPTDPSDDGVHIFTSEGSSPPALPSRNVTAVTEDREGLLWVGTAKGLAYLFNAPGLGRGREPAWVWPQRAEREEGENPYLLFSVQVNDLAVDPANRLWVATDEGAYLIERVENGFVEAEHFTAANSPLLSNQVLEVAIDEASGTVYFNTALGLVAYQGDALEPTSEAEDLFVYPNPVVMGEAQAPEQVCVQGLVEATEVRVLSPTGAVIASRSARGGQTCWRTGEADAAWLTTSPSGVYIVAAVGQNGEGTAYGKLALIR